MSTKTKSSDGGLSSDPLKMFKGSEVRRFADSVSVKLPRCTLRRLPYLLKLIVIANGVCAAGLLLIDEHMWPYAMGVLLLGTTVTFFTCWRRTEWRIEDRKLSVQHLPFPGRRSWKIGDVGEIKPAPGNAGLLVRITGKGIIEVECPAEREVLEYAARILNENLRN
jgi:hypothetical protein